MRKLLLGLMSMMVVGVLCSGGFSGNLLTDPDLVWDTVPAPNWYSGDGHGVERLGIATDGSPVPYDCRFRIIASWDSSNISAISPCVQITWDDETWTTVPVPTDYLSYQSSQPYRINWNYYGVNPPQACSSFTYKFRIALTYTQGGVQYTDYTSEKSFTVNR